MTAFRRKAERPVSNGESSNPVKEKGWRQRRSSPFTIAVESSMRER